jgi:hypothetical protein
MAATPELLQPESPQVVEHAEEFPETILQSTGAQIVQKNFTGQVMDDNGQPIIQTPPAQVITVNPPADPATLATQAKGPVTSSLTWLAAFWLRVIKRALHFGWRVAEPGSAETSS